MKRTAFIALLFLVALFFSCDEAITSPSTDDGPISIDRIPVFSSSSTIVPVSRSVIPADMAVGDFFYTLFAPPITKFEESSEVFTVGDSIEVDLFSNTVTLVTSLTDEGYIKLAGPIVEKDEDDENVETGKIEILYDKANSRFSYYSEILISDPDEIILSAWWGTDAHMYVIHEIPFTSIGDDNSFLANFTTLAYLKYNYDLLEVQLIDGGELYSGPGDSDGWIIGFADTSFKSLEASDFPYAGISNGVEGTLVDDTGIPIAKESFAERRTTIVGARDELFSYEAGFIGNPLVGFRNISAAGSGSTEIYLSMNSNGEDGFYLQDFFGNNLSNSADESIVFAPDATDASRVEMNESNIDLLISGLPNADWRSKTTLDL